ncbi:hypothetical protein D6C84_01935 [Aureobasidium pullulans]|uniref:Uncharacterized protein n=1 Tax=Aureobasidium pullulans TaxID=5580 RepID=A0A4S9Y5E9_AURPU|nr:hypothetical protein D6C84_01935 [Aureobasidium pullulans]
MPARKHPSSSDVAISSSPTSPHPKSSLRRLSSLANLHQFNPFNSFNRRRSSHGTQASDDDPYLLNPYQQQPKNQSRRQSYMSLSEDPMPALPRSRTFGHLPLTRTRQSSKPPVSMAPPSRIPTPSGSLTAKGRLASATKSILKVGNRRALVRSDTEPLLAPHRSPDVPASTRVINENLSQSASKPASEFKLLQLNLPEVPLDPSATNMHRFRSSFNALKRPQTPVSRAPPNLPRRDSLQPPTPRTPITTLPPGKLALNSSINAAKPRRQTMLSPDIAPLHSLCETTPLRASMNPDIQSRQLLTPRAAPTSPPPSYTRPSATHLQPDDATSNVNIASDLVTSAQSMAYWSGRLMSQFDRHRNDRLQKCMCRGELSATYLENDLNLCLKELKDKCVTDAAKLSFAMFKARVYVKAGTLVTTKGKAESGAEGRSQDVGEA